MRLFTRVATIYLCVVSFGVSADFWNEDYPTHILESSTVPDDPFTDVFKFLGGWGDFQNSRWPRRPRESEQRPPSNNGWNAGLDPVRPINDRNCPKLDRTQKVKLSTPVECARTCREDEPPKTCYYRFHVEHYSIAGAACNLCSPNITNMHCSNCQCVMADGIERSALIVNRMLPGPAIEVCKNDRVVVDVTNRLQGMGLTIHWHGILQEGTQYYDGVPFVTQCPIPEGNTFRYQWTAENSGTHFWHAHTGLHKMDGVFGPLIVRKPQNKDVHGRRYDYDMSSHVIIVNDWMHDGANNRFPGNLRTKRGQGPNSLLINGKGQWKDPVSGNKTGVPLEIFHVKPNHRYRFRLINAFCTVCPSQLIVEGHKLTVIAADGQPVEPVEVDSIVSFAGERYDFILNTDKKVGTYWIQLIGIGPCLEQQIQQLAHLRYTGGLTKPQTEAPTAEPPEDGVVLNPIDAVCYIPRTDAICVSNLKSAVPINQDILRRKPDVKIYLSIKFFVYNTTELFQPNTFDRFMVTGSGSHLTSMVNGISFSFPNSPLLSQLDDIPQERFCNRSHLPQRCTQDEPCNCIHNINIPKDALVEVILVDDFQAPGISHPFHLHGYHPYVIGMGRSPDENVRRISLKHAMQLDKRNLLRRRFDLPPAKDTFPVPNNGYLIFRFHARNPGFWLFHCHFVYHQITGMELLLHVGEQSDLPPIPRGFPKCNSYMPPIG